MSDLAKKVATRFQAGAKARTPEELLQVVEEAQSALHRGLNFSRPDDATREEQVKLAKIERVLKAMYDQSESVRLDLDEWIIDYKEARKP